MRALVAVGYAIGAGLVLAHRRGLIPRPRYTPYSNKHERGFRATWFGVEVDVWRPHPARRPA